MKNNINKVIKNNYIKLLSSIFAITLLFSLQSCEKDSVASSDELSFLSYTSEELVTAEVKECTMDNESEITLVDLNSDVTNRFKGNNNFRRRDGNAPIRFEIIFRQLNLSDEQKTQIKAALVSGRDCLKASRAAFLEINAEALAAAKASRQDVMAQYKAGAITIDEAKAQLKVIHQTLKAAISATGSVQETKLAIENCINILDSSIEEILTPEQLAKWNDWKSKRIDKRR